MIFFAGIYYGAMYGGSTTSILLNTPGETGTMVTALEGFKMAKSGRAGAALATSAIGSFVAGTIATVLVTLFAPVVAEFAVKLGPPEYFMLMLLAFTTVSAVLGKSTLRGMTALFIGLAIGPGRLDQITGQVRYTGGVPELLDGIEVCWWRWACSPWARPVHRAVRGPRSRESENRMSKVHMTRERVAPLLAGLAARHGDRLSVRHHPGRRHRDPHLPELRHREASWPSTSRVRHHRRHRRRGRPRGGQQRGR
jgi:putative tricarboxylic transport membrane protein